MARVVIQTCRSAGRTRAVRCGGPSERVRAKRCSLPEQFGMGVNLSNVYGDFPNRLYSSTTFNQYPSGGRYWARPDDPGLPCPAMSSQMWGSQDACPYWPHWPAGQHAEVWYPDSPDYVDTLHAEGMFYTDQYVEGPANWPDNCPEIELEPIGSGKYIRERRSRPYSDSSEGMLLPATLASEIVNGHAGATFTARWRCGLFPATQYVWQNSTRGSDVWQQCCQPLTTWASLQSLLSMIWPAPYWAVYDSSIPPPGPIADLSNYAQINLGSGYLKLCFHDVTPEAILAAVGTCPDNIADTGYLNTALRALLDGAQTSIKLHISFDHTCTLYDYSRGFHRVYQRSYPFDDLEITYGTWVGEYASHLNRFSFGQATGLQSSIVVAEGRTLLTGGTGYSGCSTAGFNVDNTYNVSRPVPSVPSLFLPTLNRWNPQ